MIYFYFILFEVYGETVQRKNFHFNGMFILKIFFLGLMKGIYRIKMDIDFTACT